MALADYSQIANVLGIPLYLYYIIIIWSLIWKALALWKSARKNRMIWFIVLLVVNTVGILEILYIFIFSKIGEAKVKKEEKRGKKSSKKKSNKTKKK
jgi:methionyl-tRNA synthetase